MVSTKRSSPNNHNRPGDPEQLPLASTTTFGSANDRRLERYLAMVNKNEITPVMLLSKCDLVSSDEVEEIKKNIISIAPHPSVLAFSNLIRGNITAIKSSLLSGKTYCLLGSSGVGKTTLLNTIIGSEQFETQAVSKKQNKGRHTTTSRELVRLDNGALLIAISIRLILSCPNTWMSRYLKLGTPYSLLE